MSFSVEIEKYFLDYDYYLYDKSISIHADCFELLGRIPKSSIHAIVTDPPYGVKEYDFDQIEKRKNGNGGIWRIPPSFDGHVRSPLPRFTALNDKERVNLTRFSYEWGKLALRVLKPGGHVLIASNSFLSQLVFNSLIKSGLKFRGQIIRLVRTLRGGDRPKNAEDIYPEVCSMPRGCYEPWGIFRKPFSTTIKQCLDQYQTGGLRRLPNGNPLFDVIKSEKPSKIERKIANHPTLKPQSCMRQIVYTSLPLGEGIILDPFMGSGSTLAAANAMNLTSIGIERYYDYFNRSKTVIPSLTEIEVDIEDWTIKSSAKNQSKSQLSIPI